MQKTGTVEQRNFLQSPFEDPPVCLHCLFTQGVIKYGGCSPHFPYNPNISSDCQGLELQEKISRCLKDDYSRTSNCDPCPRMPARSLKSLEETSKTLSAGVFMTKLGSFAGSMRKPLSRIIAA